MEDKRIVRSSNSHTLRTQKILSNKKVITAILILEDFLLLAVWNILLNFFGNLITTLKFHQSIDHQHMIQVWFYTGPGAWKFYIIFVIFVAAFDALQAYHIYTSFSEKDINVGQKGTQRWTTTEEIIQQYKEIPDRDLPYDGDPGIIISRIGNKLYIDPSPVNNLIFGITRSGKDEIYVNPSVDVYSRAKNQPSLIIADPKIETYRVAKKILEQRGYLVYLLNLDDPLHSMGDNPLDSAIQYAKANENAKAMAVARAFAFSIFHSDAEKSEPIWANTATDLFTALILAHITDALKEDEVENARRYAAFLEKQKEYLYLTPEEQKVAVEDYAKAISEGKDITVPSILTIPTEKSFWYLYENEKKINIYSIINLFTNLVRIKDEENPNVSQLDYYFNSRDDMDIAKLKYATIETSSDRTRGSIYTNMLSQLGVFIDENIAKMTAESTLNLKEIGFGEKPVAIFLGIPDYDKSNHFIASTFIRQVYYVNVQSAVRKNGKCDRKIKFILNEFGNLPPIEAMEELITVGAGRGITFDLYVQSFQQLTKLYKDDAATIRDNCGNKIYIKSTDKDTLEEFVQMLGNETIIDVQRTGERLSFDKHIMESSAELSLLNLNQLKNLMEGEVVIDRTMKRRDNQGNHITPYPIFNSFENGRRLLYRYEYLQDSFPDADSIPLYSVLTESREHIDLSDRILDYKKFTHGAGQSVPVMKFQDLENYQRICEILSKVLGENYQEEYSINGSINIPLLSSLIAENRYIPEEIRMSILGLIESEVA